MTGQPTIINRINRDCPHIAIAKNINACVPRVVIVGGGSIVPEQANETFCWQDKRRVRAATKGFAVEKLVAAAVSQPVINVFIAFTTTAKIAVVEAICPVCSSSTD